MAMRWIVLSCLGLLLSACASDPQSSNTSQPAVLASVTKDSPVALYSGRYFVNFAAALNQHGETALRGRIDLQKSLDYLEQQYQLSLNTQQREGLASTYSAIIDSTLAALFNSREQQWKYIASEQSSEPIMVSYYRLVTKQGCAYYRFIWFEGTIVNMFNLNTGIGVQDTFDLVVDIDSYQRQHPQQRLERLGDFFNYMRQANYTQLMFAYNDLPKPLKFHDMVLSGIMQAYTDNPQMVLPAPFVIYMQKQQPIHPRFFAYYYNQQHYQLAEACLRVLPKSVLADVRMQMELAELYRAKGEQAQAEALLVEGILNFPDESFAYLGLLDSSITAGEYQQAELVLKVLYDRFALAFSRSDFVAFSAGRDFVKSQQYQRYQNYID